jgi:quercetin dioxygenase-like cupin family protein
MLSTAIAPVTASKSTSNTVTFGNVNISVLLSAEDTGGTFSLVESVMRPGTEPPYHIHQREDETFYILEGHVSVMVDGVVHECRKGDTIFLPRGIPHTFRVRSEIARAMNFITPGGFEKYFQAIGKPALSLDAPAPGSPSPDLFEVAGRAAAANGVLLVPEQPQF